MCGGLGYVREDVPVGHPDFGKLFPCRCKLAEIEQQRLERLRAVSNLDHLAHMTFESFVPEGYGLPPDKAANLRLAYEQAQQYAEQSRGLADPVRRLWLRQDPPGGGHRQPGRRARPAGAVRRRARPARPPAGDLQPQQPGQLRRAL